MAGNSLEFTWSLVDKGSAPAKKIAGGLDGIDAAMAKVNATSRYTGNGLDNLTAPAKLSRFQKLSQSIGNVFGAKAHSHFQATTQAIAGLDDELGSVGLSLGGVVGGAAAAGAAVLAVAAGLTVAGSKLAVSSAGFREDALISLEALLGDSVKASKMYEQILDVADKVGLDKGNALSRFQVLVNKGLGEKQALGALEAIANIEALGEAGGKEGKKFIKELNDAIAKGDTKGIDKVIDKINKSKIGGLGEKKGQTIGRLAGDVVGNFERLFDKVDISPLKNILKSTIDALQGPAGEKLRASFERFFGGVFKIVEKLLGGGTPEQTIDKLASVIDSAGAGAERLSKGIDSVSTGIDAIKTATGIALLDEQLGKVNGKLSTFGVISTAVFSTFGTLVQGVFLGLGSVVFNEIGKVGELVSGLGPKIQTALFGFPALFTDAGYQMAAGLASGIRNGASQAIQAAIDMAKGAVDAVTGALRIRSPSKVFEGLGDFTAKGFGEGLVANDTVPNAAADMAASATTAAATGAAAASISAASAPAASVPAGGNVYHIASLTVRANNADELAAELERVAATG